MQIKKLLAQGGEIIKAGKEFVQHGGEIISSAVKKGLPEAKEAAHDFGIKAGPLLKDMGDDAVELTKTGGEFFKNLANGFVLTPEEVNKLSPEARAQYERALELFELLGKKGSEALNKVKAELEKAGITSDNINKIIAQIKEENPKLVETLTKARRILIEQPIERVKKFFENNT